MIDNMDCTGCGACKNICPKNAITMKSDKYGYIVPIINTEKCISCNKCEKVCPQKNKIDKEKTIKVYAAYNKDKKMHVEGSSGGVFGNIAEYVLNNSGIIFGCVLDEKFNAKHIEISSVEELKSIKKSKYIQSEVGDVFLTIEKHLKKQKKVLFVGTSCQVAGLKKFLAKEYNNLITIDVLCHGVPNNKIFHDYINYYESKHNCKILEYDFRYKDDRLGNYITYLKIEKNKKIKKLFFPWQGTSYAYLFMKNYILRDSCYNCNYVSIERVSDITLGDYWGINKINEKMSNKLGVSMVLVNSKKGINIFNNIKENLIYVETTIEDALKSNLTLSQKVKEPKDRKNLLEKYVCTGYKTLETYYKKFSKDRFYPLFVFYCRKNFPLKLYKYIRKIKK